MAVKIGINAPFLDEELTMKIKNTAEKHGFETVFFANNEDACKNSNGCEVLFGSFPLEAIKSDKSLKWLQCSFAGVDKVIDDSLYEGRDVVITNAAGAYGITISEHIITVILMMLRRMPEYGRLVADREWKLIGNINSIMGSRITVVGMGDIGTNFAKRAKALGASLVRGVRRTNKPSDKCYDEVYLTDNLDEAVKDVDIVVLCVPGTDATTHMIDERRLSLMKDGSYIVNVGRGWAIDQPALIRALESGKLAGAALDVAVPEPLPKDDPLWNAPNILITPHVSGNMSLGITRHKAVNIFCSNLERYAKGERLGNIIDRKAGY